MKKKLLLFSAFAFCSALEAQEYTPLQVSSGYNADVIANGVNSALLSTTDAVDNANFAFMSADFQAVSGNTPPDYALPVSGLITSATTPGLTYQLAPYSGDNSLRLQEQSDSGILNISNAAPATALYLLVTSGSGESTLAGTIHFSDNTTQLIAPGTVPDWFFSNALPVEISGFGRVGRLDDIMENPAGDPRLYKFTVPIAVANQTKTITSIEFSKTSAAEGIINILGVSAQLLGTCPGPSAVTLTNITLTGVTVNWTSSVVTPTQGYDIFVTPSGTPPAASAIPYGNVANGPFTITDLMIGQHYCVWVRSRCSDTEFSGFISMCFNTGEISVTDNSGDIPTLYSDDEVTVSSTTSCPGTLSVTVPAGYQISSVGTMYQMQTASNGWMEEQRSLLVCNTTGNMESEVTSGIGGTTGTFSYSRSGLNIANGATGTVEFELRAWRMYGGSDCNTTYNRVMNGTWSVTIVYQPLLAVKDFSKNSFSVYPNPANDILNVSGDQVISEARLFNLLGQEILVQEGANDKQMQLNISGLPTGKYFLKVLSENGVQTLSVLKK